METSFVQAVKLSIMGATGLSKDALHVHIGIGAFVLAALVFRRPWRSALPLMVAVALACMGEWLDLRDDLRSLGFWRWRASLHDLVNTTFWPLVLFMLARWRRGRGA